MKTCRIVINTPSSHGGIGDLYNFKLRPSLTLGCGSWGGNSVSENVGPMQLLNTRKIAYGLKELDEIRADLPDCSDGICRIRGSEVNEADVEDIVRKIMARLKDL